MAGTTAAVAAATLLLACSVAAAPITLTVDPQGVSYSLSVGDTTWLEGSAPAFFADGAWQTAGKELTLKSTTNTSGAGYTMEAFVWASAGGDEFQTNFVRFSGDKVIFQQIWLTGAQNTNSSNVEGAASAFPSFKNTTSGNPAIGCAAWTGTFIDNSVQGPTIAPWGHCPIAGSKGGFFTVFDGNATGDVLVVSSSENFMAATFGTSPTGDYQGGPLGSITSIPAGYSVGFIVSHSSTGLNNAVSDWGSKMRNFYNKTTELRDNDATVNYLGYNTDHGAYYYYNTAKEQDYNQTLVAVKEQADSLGIPYQYVLLDSWWYFKGTGNGVKNWTAMPSIFPPGGAEGLRDFTAATKPWGVIGHNRYWSNNTDYSTQNGGKFQFSSSEYKMVVPLEQAFWDYLMSSSKAWGLTVYEQDWLYNEFLGVPLLHENATMAREWLLQMGRAALKNDLTIQYCMAYPRHALQSLEIPAVTQIRASDDYVPGGDKAPRNFHIGSSSILAHALGLAPFKDNFWTNTREPGSSCGSTLEPDVWRQGAVATYSTGPVTPSDGLGFENKSLIMSTCRTDGLLLKPSRPATSIDRHFGAVAGTGSGPSTSSYVWSTYSDIGGDAVFYHLFASELEAPYQLDTTEFNLDGKPGAASYFAWRVDTIGLPFSTFNLTVVHDGEFELRVVPTNEFDLHHFAPVLSFGGALIGETDKFVPVSPKRFSGLDCDSAACTVSVAGAPNESVAFYTVDSKLSLHAGKCAFGPAGGSMTATFGNSDPTCK